MAEVETVKVSDGAGDYVVINKNDFIKGKHTIWTPEKAEKEKAAIAAAAEKAGKE
jgi:hypothetical protein